MVRWFRQDDSDEMRGSNLIENVFCTARVRVQRFANLLFVTGGRNLEPLVNRVEKLDFPGEEVLLLF